MGGRAREPTARPTSCLLPRTRPTGSRCGSTSCGRARPTRLMRWHGRGHACGTSSIASRTARPRSNRALTNRGRLRNCGPRRSERWMRRSPSSTSCAPSWTVMPPPSRPSLLRRHLRRRRHPWRLPGLRRQRGSVPTPLGAPSGLGGVPGSAYGGLAPADSGLSALPVPDPEQFGDGVAVTLPDGSTVTAPNPVAADAVRHALTQLGVPYVWGGTSPGVGLDCSGLTQWAYHEAGLDLPRLAQEQDLGAAVNQSSLRPGDLAVWDGHVAMVVGNGMMIEAGDPVQLSPIRTDERGSGFSGLLAAHRLSASMASLRPTPYVPQSPMTPPSRGSARRVRGMSARPRALALPKRAGAAPPTRCLYR